MNPCVKQMRDTTDYYIRKNPSHVSFILNGAIVTESVRLSHESASVPSGTTNPVGLGTSFSMYVLTKYNTAIFKDAVLVEGAENAVGWKVGFVDSLKTEGEIYEKRATLIKIAPSENKNITAFKIGAVSGVVSQGTNTIAITLPTGTVVTSLLPVITINGKLISPVIAQDFTIPVVYTVTAENLTTQAYTVTVTVAV